MTSLDPLTAHALVPPIHFPNYGWRDFERLVFAHALVSEKGADVQWLGSVGGDDGTDILCVRRKGEVGEHRIHIQCKNHRNGGGLLQSVLRDIEKCCGRGARPHVFRLVLGCEIRPETREAIERRTRQLRIRHCEIWSAGEFEARLRITHEVAPLFAHFALGRRMPFDGRLFSMEKAARLRERAVLRLGGPFRAALHVDRDQGRAIDEYLAGESSLLFPIHGPAGAGKSWEIRNLLQRLPGRLVPIVIVARLADTLVEQLVAELHESGLVAPEMEKRVPSILVREAQSTLASDFRLLVLIEGLNEFQLEEGNRLRAEVKQLLEILTRSSCKSLMTCRSFAWDRIFVSQPLLAMSHPTKAETKLRTEWVWDDDEKEMTTVETAKVAKSYGLELGEFDTLQREIFWAKVAALRGQSMVALGEVHDLRDPFLCGLVAGRLLEIQATIVHPVELLAEYVALRRDGGGTPETRRLRRDALDRVALEFFDGAGPFRTYVTEKQLHGRVDEVEVDHFVNAGLMEECRSKRGRVLIFSHDRVMEFVVASALWTHRLSSLPSPQLQACVAFGIIIRSEERSAYRDYCLRVGASLLRRIVPAPAKEILDVDSAFAQLLDVLRAGVPGETVPHLWSLLGFGRFSYQVTRLLRERADRAAVATFLANRDLADFSPDELLCAVVIAGGLPNESALAFLLRAASSEHIAVRIAVAGEMGELRVRDPECVRWLRSQFLSKGGWSELKSTCLWALGQVGECVSARERARYSSDQCARWRLGQYVRDLGANGVKLRTMRPRSSKSLAEPVCISMQAMP